MEIKQIIFILFFLASIGIFAFTVNRLWGFVKRVKPLGKPVDDISGRALHTLKVAFGQSKILRKWQFGPGIMHATIFWGFLVITLGTVEMMVDGILGTERIFGFLGPIYSMITVSGEIFAVLIIFAVFGFLIRRFIIKPKRFIAPEMKPSSNTDATIILIMTFSLMASLLLMNIGYLLITPEAEIAGFYPVSQALTAIFSAMPAHLLHETGWWIHIGLVLIFLNILPYSKHFHVIVSIPNVFLKNLEPAGKLANMASVTTEIKLMLDPAATPPAADAAPPARFGFKDVEDLTWKNILDSYTCTECGRCSASCPANITGKLLSPRKIFKDVRHRMTEKGPGLVKEATYEDAKSLFDYITPEELWGCTTCGACMAECPVEIQHVPLIVGMRQYLVMELSQAPQALNAMFNNIENNGCPWPMPASSRFDWANNITTRANK